ncbi:MAG: ribosome assembly RNA-binding protein YhbY [Lachnospiraceae bacterium]|nr:ribosome assembly RNA-binding protein YhbY [Lachnospiraceae bacterium]
MTSKERALLRSQAHHLEPIVHVGKDSLTPEVTAAVDEALEARELIKVGVLKNCFDDPNEIAQIIAERTKSQVVQVMGKKITLYRKNNKKNDKR